MKQTIKSLKSTGNVKLKIFHSKEIKTSEQIGRDFFVYYKL